MDKPNMSNKPLSTVPGVDKYTSREVNIKLISLLAISTNEWYQIDNKYKGGNVAVNLLWLDLIPKGLWCMPIVLKNFMLEFIIFVST